MKHDYAGYNVKLKDRFGLRYFLNKSERFFIALTAPLFFASVCAVIYLFFIVLSESIL